eukprot:1158082-Pelagomonas_calceolata.AAC.7
MILLQTHLPQQIHQWTYTISRHQTTTLDPPTITSVACAACVCSVRSNGSQLRRPGVEAAQPMPHLYAPPQSAPQSVQACKIDVDLLAKASRYAASGMPERQGALVITLA